MERYTLGALEEMGMLSLGRGKVISRRDLLEQPGPYPVYSSSAADNGEIGRWGAYLFDDERITWSIDGGGKLFYRPAHRYSVTNVGGWLRVHSPALSTKFLYYVLSAQWEKLHFDYVKKAHPSVIRACYTVPLLPIAQQEEIVAILDPFQALTDALSAELEGRRVQLGWLRDRLLTGETQMLSAVAELIDCPHSSPRWQESGVPVIRNFNLCDGRIDPSRLSFVSEEEYRLRVKRAEPAPGDLLFSREAPVGNVGVVPEGFRCCQGQRVVLLRPDREKILPEFLAQALQSGPVRRSFRRTGSTVENLTLAELRKVPVPVPAPQRQRELLETLRPLLELTGKTGIPAEIEARQAQFRFVREKLI